MAILTAQGVPAAAKHIKDRLAEIDPALGLAIMSWPEPPFERWAVTLHWPAQDPRRVAVREGTLAPDKAFDVLLVLPVDCPPEQAYGYLTNALKAWSGSKAEVGRLLDRVHHYNAAQQQRILAPTTELAEELIQANARTLFRKESGHVASTQRPTRTGKALDRKRAAEYMRDAS